MNKEEICIFWGTIYLSKLFKVKITPRMSKRKPERNDKEENEGTGEPV